MKILMVVKCVKFDVEDIKERDGKKRRLGMEGHALLSHQILLHQSNWKLVSGQ